MTTLSRLQNYSNWSTLTICYLAMSTLMIYCLLTLNWRVNYRQYSYYTRYG